MFLHRLFYFKFFSYFIFFVNVVVKLSKIMKFSFVFLFLLRGLNFEAQSIVPDGALTIELGLPNAAFNKPYRAIMQGLVCVSPYYQYSLKNHITFGLGLHYSYFGINEFRVQPKIYGGIHTAALFFKFGYERFWRERFGTDLACKFGYLKAFSVSDLIPNYKENQATFIEPSIAFIVTSSVNSSYRFTVGYPFYGYYFTPNTIGIVDSNLGYSVDEYSKISSLFTISFGFTFYFNGKKNTDED